MLRNLILLTGPVEQPVLTALLRSHNAELSVRPVTNLGELKRLAPLLLRSARLVGFCTGTVVPRTVLGELAFGAYNFHPGSPRFPGTRAAQRAIQQGAREFGATAHVMVETVDAGPIVGAELFQIHPGSTVDELEQLTYLHLVRLFRSLARPLACQIEPLATLPFGWHATAGMHWRRAQHRRATARPPEREPAFYLRASA